ncbi:reductase (plasmid) [Rathayibacter sp. VKM Ac-2803]|uniref:dihydrofolate reductase family protein n=1 Tax=Rathayibacter sp. VKM Ac-2803 TaxID=2609256 RepID=UPI00135C3BA1|nr:dihydrofolate reductase family protein [Rathayibacter sp. VKM Ac-2803]MWV51462.1 reductase [Rathayibacter sp. VKM Ac-2803]
MSSSNRPRVVVQEWISLDGYASGPTDEMDIMSAISEDTDQRSQTYNAEFLSTAAAVLLGSRTYRKFVEYWPSAEEPIADQVNQLPKLVASTTLQSAPWGEHTPATVITDVYAHVRQFRREGEGTLVVWGSLALTHSLMNTGLVDELDLFVAPIWLGEGTPLLPAGRVRVEQLSSDNWDELTHLTYRVENHDAFDA